MNRRHVVEHVDGRLLLDLEPEHRALLRRRLVQKQIVLMEVNRRVERILGSADAGDVIDVRVRQQDVLDIQLMIAHGAQEAVHLVARINDDTFTRPLASGDEPVLVERCFRANLQDHSLQCYT